MSKRAWRALLARAGSPFRKAAFALVERRTCKAVSVGHSFGPGELDTALEYSDDARYLVLDALSDVR